VSRRLDQIIAGGVLVAIVFTGLAHGAVEAWSIAVFQLLVIALIELWTVRMVMAGRVRIAVPAPTLPLVGLIVLGLVQSISWTGTDGRRASLSLDVDMTRWTVPMLVILVAAFLIAANFWASRERLPGLGWFLTAFGLTMAVFGLIQGFTWNGRFYWVRPMGALTAAYGPFLSHNNFAGYMELFIPIPIAMALTKAVRSPARMFCAFAAVIMSLSVMFSLSRGGMISIAAGLVFLAVFGVQMALQRRRAWEMEEWGDDDEFVAPRWRRVPAWLPQATAVAAIVVAIVVGLLWLGPDSVASRLTQGELTGSGQSGQNFEASRGWIWRDTWTMFGAHPLLGAGLGAYRTAFPMYTQSDGFYLVHQSHNDYLQILADGGVVGGALAVWFLISVFRAFGRGIGARDPWLAALALGGGAALFSLLVHSLLDFNLQLPGTALLFLVLAAVVARIGERAREVSVGTELQVAAARREVTQWR